MPVLWEWRDSILLVTTVGAYSNDELSRAFSEVRADPDFVGGPVVFDARESKAALTKSDIEWRVGGFANMLRQHGFGPQLAFVLSGKEPHRYGIARMVQALVDGFDIEVFDNVDAALRWAHETAGRRPNESR